MNYKNPRRIALLSLCAGVGVYAPNASAIVTFGGAVTNIPPPPDGVGNYEGYFGSYMGTTVSSQFMVTATHVSGNTTNTFTFFNGTSTPTIYNIQLAAEMDDLAIWEIVPGSTGTAASFSTFAPVYTGNSETGMSLIDVGRGNVRGAAVTGGFAWTPGAGGYSYSWGDNTVAAVMAGSQIGAPAGFGGDFIQSTFNNNPTDPNEGIVANYDSGGGVFVDNNGVYQLDGVNSLVQLVLDSSGNAVQAALYNTSGYYEYNAMNQLTQIVNGGPESSFATRVSSKYNLLGALDGGISKSAIASSPIVDSGGVISIFSSSTTGSINGAPTLTIGNGTLTPTLQIASGSGTSVLASLTIDTGSTLDITNNNVIIDTDSMKSTFIQLLKSGENGGLWNGVGIQSSTAAQNSNYGVGLADGSDLSVTGLSSGQLELAYTLYGDCNLDGVVNISDFNAIIPNYGLHVTNGWEQGDFGYDGVVDITDFNLFEENFGLTASGKSLDLPTSEWAAVDAFAAANGLQATGPLTNLPEPSPILFGAFAVAGILACRRTWRQPTPAIVADQSSP